MSFLDKLQCQNVEAAEKKLVERLAESRNLEEQLQEAQQRLVGLDREAEQWQAKTSEMKEKRMTAVRIRPHAVLQHQRFRRLNDQEEFSVDPNFYASKVSLLAENTFS